MRTSTSACGGKRLLQERQPAFELVVADGQRRQQPDHVAVEAAREQQQPAVERLGGDPLRELGTLLRELEREHRAEAANLADRVVPGGELVEPTPQDAAELVGAGP